MPIPDAIPRWLDITIKVVGLVVLDGVLLCGGLLLQLMQYQPARP